MKTKLRFFILLLLSSVILSSCDLIFEKEANYSYKIKNGTSSKIDIVVEIKSNPSVNIHGTPYRYYTIEPNSTINVWSTSGFTTDEVYDEEKKNGEIYWIKVLATSYGRNANNNLNNASRWQYLKQSNYKATYTLVIDESDF